MTQTAPAPAANPGSLRFLLTLGAWFVGLFGLMRLDWVENVLLTPFAQIQQQVADQLTGAHTDLLYFNASCSGGDPMALCAGAILAYPATWGARFRAAALGLLAITLLNVVRIGHLSLVAADNSLFQLLHIYVWPGILILATAAYVFAWMNREGRAAPAGGSASRIALSAAARRFVVLAVVLVVAYFATAPFFYESSFVDVVVARWIAATGGAILVAAGTAVTVAGPVIRTAHGGFRVTQECIFTPLIPLYIAGALSAPLVPWRRFAAWRPRRSSFSPWACRGCWCWRFRLRSSAPTRRRSTPSRRHWWRSSWWRWRPSTPPSRAPGHGRRRRARCSRRVSASLSPSRGRRSAAGPWRSRRRQSGVSSARHRSRASLRPPRRGRSRRPARRGHRGAGRHRWSTPIPIVLTAVGSPDAARRRGAAGSPRPAQIVPTTRFSETGDGC